MLQRRVYWPALSLCKEIVLNASRMKSFRQKVGIYPRLNQYRYASSHSALTGSGSTNSNSARPTRYSCRPRRTRATTP
jgi:hypothetical protein